MNNKEKEDWKEMLIFIYAISVWYALYYYWYDACFIKRLGQISAISSIFIVFSNLVEAICIYLSKNQKTHLNVREKILNQLFHSLIFLAVSVCCGFMAGKIYSLYFDFKNSELYYNIADFITGVFHPFEK